MAYETTNLKWNNFVIRDGYFYYMDHQADALMKKTSGGNIAYSYPLDTVLSSEVICLFDDGIFFWTLEDAYIDDPESFNFVIKKWLLDTDGICKLQTTFNYTETGSYKYQSNTFIVESYHTTFSEDVPKNSDYIALTEFYNLAETTHKIFLGPNSDGDSEYVTITGTISQGKLGLDFFTAHNYEQGDNINIYGN
jgi:hypothetical protein